MTRVSHLAGVYAAAITPLTPTDSLDLPALPLYLSFLAQRGCHGALLLGTTGEGPSFAHAERVELMRVALQVRQEHPDFRLLAGTGTPSLEETVANTSAAFDLGMNGVVVLPPYYFRNASDEGLYAWFSRLIRRAVPEGGALFGYHIPGVSGVALSLDLISRLKDAFPERFAGIKDSSGSLEHAQALGARFGNDLVILNGNDKLLSASLQACGSGCITAQASLCSPYLRRVWEAHLRGESAHGDQAILDAGRDIMDTYPPAPPLLKALLAYKHGFPLWSVRPPLLDYPQGKVTAIAAELDAAYHV
jgi:4-hydroxy-tetrahydrodipicolinate synthase